MPEAEMSQDEQEWILPLFLAEYNAQHKTSFEFKHKCEHPDRSCDYYFRSPKDGELKTQWTKAGTYDKENGNERVFLKQEHTVIRALKEAVKSRDHRGYKVDITLQRVPNSEAETRQLVNCVMFLLNEKTPCEPDPNLTLCYEFDRTDMEKLATLQVDRLAIYRIADSDSPTGIVCSSALAEAAPAGEKRAQDALVKKIKRYGSSGHDLVIVIHFDFEPYMKDEIEKLKADLANETLVFKEIWTFCEWTSTCNIAKAQLVWQSRRSTPLEASLNRRSKSSLLSIVFQPAHFIFKL